MWIEFIKAAEDGMPVKEFEVPDNIEFVEIDRRTGYRGGKYKEAYIKGNGPPSYSAPAPVEEATVVEEVAPLESL